MTNDPRPMVVEFAEPARRMNMNDRSHWSTRHRRTKVWRETAKVHALRDLGRSPSERRREPSFVRVSFPVRDPGRRRDPHNLAPTVKAIVDGLVDAGVWPDDVERWVTVLDPAVTVTLYPRAGAIPE